MRIEGRRVGDRYVISGPGVSKRIPLDEAREDRKLLAAIKRNNWEPVDGGQ